MLQISLIRSNPQEIISRLAVKNFNATSIINDVIELDELRRNTQKNLDEMLSELNILAKETGLLFKQGNKAGAETLKEKSAVLKTSAREFEEKLKELEEKLQNMLLQLPNLPHPDVKHGHSATDNTIILEDGDISGQENGLPHWELTSKYKIIDFDLGSKITGAGFPVYIGKGAKLQRALISFFLDQATEAGYTEIQPPLMVNAASAYGTGQLPDKDGQMYYAGADDLYLIPTAEVPVTNLYRDVLLKASDFPIKNTAYSACFRREAGSYGKDVRGLNRLHQFDKVEIVQIQHPEQSYQTLEEMKDHVAMLLRKLKLPFRIVKLCGGDMSFTSALTYDFEVYAKAQKKWLEVSSVSNFESYQAHRMKLRFKDENGKIHPAHTLNGSALALPRIVAAILENFQSENGIIVPEILRPYTGFDIINES